MFLWSSACEGLPNNYGPPSPLMLLTEAVNAKNDVMTSRGHVMGPTAVDTRRINLMTDIAVGIGR
ncbi:hypothetical protein Pcac1_g23179 [Phytophthora cactorum]|nr:hypothetical protein Pcac1_g23179 [Phytophthora cactorum]